MKQLWLSHFHACFQCKLVVPEDLNGLTVHLACSPARQTHCISLSFSKTPFEHCGDKNEVEGIPRVLQKFDQLREREAC